MFPLCGSRYDEENRIWSGPKIKDLYSSVMTIAEAVFRVLHRNPIKVIEIMHNTGEKMTAQQFMNFSRCIAKKLMTMNVQGQAAIIGLYVKNTRYVSSIMMAAFLVGSPVSAIYPEADKKTVKLLFQQTLPKIIFCDMENFSTAKAVCEDLNLESTIVIANGEMESVLNVSEILDVQYETTSLDLIDFPCVHMSGKDTAVILFSSVDTGKLKGVLYSHYALLNTTLYHTIKSKSVVFCFSTMNLARAVLNMMESLLTPALRIITDKSFKSDAFLRLIKHYGVTHLIAAGNNLAALLLQQNGHVIREYLASVDTILFRAAQVSLKVHKNLIQILFNCHHRLEFSSIYWKCEVSQVIAYNTGPVIDFQLGSQGKLSPNTQIRIIDKDNQNMGPNETGEILISSPYKCKGYFRNPAATAKAFIGQWLYTGDLGYIDEQGYLHVRGYAKNMFKYKNYKIYPELIENVILQILDVREVCVFPRPNLMTDNLIACAIVCSEDREGSLTSEYVKEYVAQHLDSYHQIRGGIYFVTKVPMTISGKIKRNLVPQLIFEDGK